MKNETDLPHMAIEDYVRDKLSEYGEYTSFHSEKFNAEMKDGQPFRKQMEDTMIEISEEFLKLRGAPKDTVPTQPNLGYWYSSYNVGDDHSLHNHGRALVAGTYYPYADKDSTVISFRSPSYGLLSVAEVWNDEQKLYHYHSPKTGDMNVWPGWLEHQVKRQREVPSDRSRIAISWNYS